MMLFQLKSYLKFLWKSSNQHGVHSPFVFMLVTQCFYDKQKKPEYALLKNYRKALLASEETIDVTDFGAGSRVFRSNKRAVAKIASTAGIRPKRAELLFRIMRYLKPQTVLEIGTSLGLATSAIALGNKKATITTLEGCTATAKIAQEALQKLSVKNVSCTITEFDSFLNADQLCSKKYDLVYFDGNHAKKATLAYFEQLLPTTHNDSVWVFDDIHWSADMEEAWEAIKKHPKTRVTIDTFQWGLVFFRTEQAKEHFVIRV